MAIISQYPHFYQDKEGKSHRNMLQIEIEPATVRNNFPKDGSLLIRLQDEEAQKAFKMTPQEALSVGEEIAAVARRLLKDKRDLWLERDARR